MKLRSLWLIVCTAVLLAACREENDLIAQYRPNLLARSLTTQKTSIIGMVISDSSNYFFGEMMRG